MNDEVKVLDLGEAAALVTAGWHMTRMDQARNGRHKVFVFSADEVAVEACLGQYRNADLQVNASTYFRAIKDIKKRIHDMNDLAEA